MDHTVFVFGTLKEGFPNFGVNRGARLPGSYVTRDAFALYLVGERHVPWMLHEPGGGLQVLGQVFRVDRAALEAMDKLERVGEPDGYVRMLLDVQASESTSPHTALSAFAYLKPAHHLDRGQVRLGPLREYTLEHAALYRPRG
jgi:gamma-glutamylaminecyclotransferase